MSRDIEFTDVKKASNLGDAFRSVRGELWTPRTDEVSEDEIQDITRVLNGAKAITGKAVWSANVASRTDADKAATRNREETSRAQREAQRMAQWDAARTSIGGVEMTNAEALQARRNVAKNADRYASIAVDRGLIAAGSEAEFVSAANRKAELMELERKNGQLSDAQSAERARLDASRVGKAVDDCAVEEFQGRGIDAIAPGADRRASADEAFASAPRLDLAFAKAGAGAIDERTQQNPVPAASSKPQSTSPTF